MSIRQARGAWVVVLAVTTFAGAPAAASGGDVRPLQPRGARLLDRGLRASPSLAALVAELRASDVVVYVDLDPNAPGSCDGALRFRGAAGGARYLHVWLNPRRVDRVLTATLGHELQHAVEVARAPEVQSLEGFTTFYGSVGTSRLPGQYETDAARATTARVRLELERTAGGRR